MMVCEHIQFLQMVFQQSLQTIYIKNKPLKCHNCLFDFPPQPNLWIHLNGIIQKKERIYFCDEHLDYSENNCVYLNLTDGVLWCRSCESRFLINTVIQSELFKILSMSKSLGIRGLKNLGNTCFINAVIQALSNSKTFKYTLIENQNSPLFKEIYKGNKLFREFVNLLNELWKIGDPIAPEDFIVSVYEEFPMIVKGNQSGAFEFLMLFINCLNESFYSATRESDNVIEDMFFGKMTTIFTCKKCVKVIKTIENFNKISLSTVFTEFKEINSYSAYLRNQSSRSSLYNTFKDIFKTQNTNKTIEDSLRAFFEMLDVDGQTELKQCDKCNERTEFTRKKIISIPPKNLILTIEKLQQGIKPNYIIKFPFFLSFSEYTENGNLVIYNLYSLIENSEDSNGEINKCYCKNHLNDRWYLFYNGNILEVSQDDVLKAKGYIGFYEQASSLN